MHIIQDTAPPQWASALPAPGGNPVLLLFIASSLFTSMSISQEEVPPPGSLTYWLLVLPALLLPLLNLPSVMRAAFSSALPILLMLLVAGLWHVIAGDTRATLQLSLFALVLMWVSSGAGRLRDKDLITIYALLIIAGFAVYLFTGLNKWGPLPGLTTADYGIWRVSFFPNIAYTAFLSLAVVMILTRSAASICRHRVAIGFAVFYLVFSFVRTALIALVAYAFLRLLFSRSSSVRRLFWGALLLGIGLNAAIALSPVVMDSLQKFPLISRLFLRGETGLSEQEIFIQLYRPWVWFQHVKIFLSSPYLMGWGVFDFNELKTEQLIDAIDWSDTVSLPTRVLAAYGLPALLFFWFLIAQLKQRAKELDGWACACFVPLLLTAMQWGSLFHPSDAMFALYFLILTRGQNGYVSAPDAPVT